ncbi:hypothetical protein ACWDV7_38500, partial [Streptomyces sp. NPDC003362]
ASRSTWCRRPGPPTSRRPSCSPGRAASGPAWAPALIVDDSRGKPYAPARLPTLRRLLADRYEVVGRVDGAVLYARIP